MPNRFIILRRIAAILSVVGIIGIAVAPQVFAADIQYVSPKSQDNHLDVNAVAGDSLYVFAPHVQVNGSTAKDASVAGGNVILAGSIGADLTAIAGNLNLSGPVKGSAHVAAGQADLDAPISGDLAILAKDAVLSNAAAIGGDVLAVGKSLEIDSPVSGSVYFAGQELYINSKVSGSVHARAGSVHLGPNAVIVGALTYTSANAVAIDSGAQTPGGISHTFPPAVSKKAIAGGLVLGLVLAMLIELAALSAIFALFKKPASALVLATNAGYWQNVLRGLIVLILVPLAAIFLSLIVLGLYIGVILAVAWVLLLMLGFAVGTASFGTWLESTMNRQPQAVGYGGIALGVIAVVLIRLIPVIGGLFILVIVCAGAGAIVSAIQRSRSAE